MLVFVCRSEVEESAPKTCCAFSPPLPRKSINRPWGLLISPCCKRPSSIAAIKFVCMILSSSDSTSYPASLKIKVPGCVSSSRKRGKPIAPTISAPPVQSISWLVVISRLMPFPTVFTFHPFLVSDTSIGIS